MAESIADQSDVARSDVQIILDRKVAYGWIVALLALTFLLPQNGVVWTIAALAAFFILPPFWEPIDTRKGKEAYMTRLLLAGVFTVILAVGAWRTTERSMSSDYSVIEVTVAAQLRDPSSAQFRNLRGDDAVCGEVNGKNAFGAYSGFRPFVYADQAVLFKPELLARQKPGQMTQYYNDVADFSRAEMQCFE